MNPFVDAIMVALFVGFMLFIFRGYHINRLKQLEEEEREHDKDAKD